MLQARFCSSARVLPVVLLLSGVILGQSEASIAVTGHVPAPLVLRASDLEKMPRATASTTNNGITTAWEGVWVSEVLKRAGVGPGVDMPGYVVATAVDGYQILFSLGELDPTVTEGQYLLADKANGKPLTGRDGSFRLVVAKDVRGLRSVRQLAKLEVVFLTPPK